MFKIRLSIIALIFCFMAGCDKDNYLDMSYIPNNPVCKYTTVNLSFNNKGNSLETKVACSNLRKMQGLMNITQLPANTGMLFVFDKEEALSFWMKDTNIALSIAFIDKNWKVLDIADMKPLDETSVISRLPALYAVETNQGWFSQQHIKVGDKILLDFR